MNLQELDYYQTLKIKKDIKDKLLSSGFDIRKGYLRFAVDRIFAICKDGSYSDENIDLKEVDISYVPEYLRDNFKRGLVMSNIDPFQIMYLKDLIFGNLTYDDLMQMQQQMLQQMNEAIMK